MDAKLELRQVRKSFGETAAVRDLSLALRPGEFVSLLGPSGCGKSTTLAMVAGFLDPDEGEILVDGRPITGLPPQRRRIGLVFQDYAVFSRMTVRANLSFGLEAQGVGRARRQAAVGEIAERLDLTALLDRRGHQLNMSEMQRVALARVLVTGPALLLLDEPMSNLDASVRAHLRGELKRIQKDLGQTVLYVTHDQVEAMSMSDRIAVMRSGEVLQIGTPEEIYAKPRDRFVAEFIGDPPINVVPCSLHRTGGRSFAASTALHEALPLDLADEPGGSEHWLGVRPHVFRPHREPAPGAAATVVRFVENFGSELVLHVDYGEDLVRVVAPPGFATEGDAVHLSVDPRRIHLIGGGGGAIVLTGGRA